MSVGSGGSGSSFGNSIHKNLRITIQVGAEINEPAVQKVVQRLKQLQADAKDETVVGSLRPLVGSSIASHLAANRGSLTSLQVAARDSATTGLQNFLSVFSSNIGPGQVVGVHGNLKAAGLQFQQDDEIMLAAQAGGNFTIAQRMEQRLIGARGVHVRRLRGLGAQSHLIAENRRIASGMSPGEVELLKAQVEANDARKDLRDQFSALTPRGRRKAAEAADAAAARETAAAARREASDAASLAREKAKTAREAEAEAKRLAREVEAKARQARRDAQDAANLGGALTPEQQAQVAIKHGYQQARKAEVANLKMLEFEQAKTVDLEWATTIDTKSPDVMPGWEDTIVDKPRVPPGSGGRGRGAALLPYGPMGRFLRASGLSPAALGRIGVAGAIIGGAAYAVRNAPDAFESAAGVHSVVSGFGPTAGVGTWFAAGPLHDRIQQWKQAAGNWEQTRWSYGTHAAMGVGSLEPTHLLAGANLGLNAEGMMPLWDTAAGAGFSFSRRGADAVHGALSATRLGLSQGALGGVMRLFRNDESGAFGSTLDRAYSVGSGSGLVGRDRLWAAEYLGARGQLRNYGTFTNADTLLRGGQSAESLFGATPERVSTLFPGFHSAVTQGGMHQGASDLFDLYALQYFGGESASMRGLSAGDLLQRQAAVERGDFMTPERMAQFRDRFLGMSKDPNVGAMYFKSMLNKRGIRYTAQDALGGLTTVAGSAPFASEVRNQSLLSDAMSMMPSPIPSGALSDLGRYLRAGQSDDARSMGATRAGNMDEIISRFSDAATQFEETMKMWVWISDKLQQFVHYSR